MSDWISMIGWGALLVIGSILAGLLLIMLIGAIMATLAIPVILIIWAIGALL